MVLDSNDNPPIFSNQNYRAVIDEGAMKFEPDLQIQARDIDKTSEITYSIIAGNVNSLFSIEPRTGKIIVADIHGLDMTNVTTNNIILTIEVSYSPQKNISKLHSNFLMFLGKRWEIYKYLCC